MEFTIGQVFGQYYTLMIFVFSSLTTIMYGTFNVNPVRGMSVPDRVLVNSY